ncbi:MAG TPA: hypothetical protein VHL58_16150 [Thermoanaerobaculia bacterium]|nr:hypothetical protein [Thermoanaerobaculia bacterium]
MKIHAAAVGVLLVLLATNASAASAAKREATLLKSRVQFSVPADWIEFRRNDSPAGGVIAYRIPNGPPTNPSANAVVTVRDAQDETLAGYANSWIESSRLVHGAVVLSRFEKGNPATDVFVLYRIEQKGVPYLAADRYSGRGTLLLQVRIAWPVFPGNTEEWRRSVLSSSNHLLSDVILEGAVIGPLGILREAEAVDSAATIGSVEAVRAEK